MKKHLKQENVWLLFSLIKKASCYRFRTPGSKNLKKTTASDISFENKNIILSGSFFPASEESLKERLLMLKAQVVTQLSSETDILICGKFPDWSLIQEARSRAIKVIFIDKASDLFSNIISEELGKFESEHVYVSQASLGI